jgi:alpha-galactosidase
LKPVKCDVSEELILSTAKALVESGLHDLGYNYVILEDCWTKKDRKATGHLVADPERFPHAMKYVADQIHSMGLKWGMYGSAGVMTCAQYPG